MNDYLDSHNRGASARFEDSLAPELGLSPPASAGHIAAAAHLLSPAGNHRHERLLGQLAVGLALLATLATILDVTVGLWLQAKPYDAPFDLALMVSLGILMMAASTLQRRNAPRQAAGLWLLWLAVALAVRAFGGSRALPPVAFAQVVPVLLATMLLGGRSGYAVAAVSLLADLSLVRGGPAAASNAATVLLPASALLGVVAFVATWCTEELDLPVGLLAPGRGTIPQVDTGALAARPEPSPAATRESQEDLEVLYALARALALNGSSVEGVAHTVTAAALEITDVTFALMLLVTRGALRPLAPCSRRPLHHTLPEGRPVPLAELPTLSAALHSPATAILGPSALATMAEHERALVGVPPAATVILVPLRWHDEALGLIVLGEQRRWQRTPIVPEKLRLVERAASDASGILNRLQPGSVNPPGVTLFAESPP